MIIIRRWGSIAALVAVYGAAVLLSGILRVRRPGQGRQGRRVLATATFFNPGWYRAHIVPLASVVDEVLLVTDGVVEPTPGVKYCCPPRWVARLTGRAAAKLLWGWAIAIRRRPDWCMGYHLFPGALTALVIGRFIGRPVCYQMTGGPVEVLGGGYAAENRLLSMLGRPSRLVERLAISVVRQFDMIVVRGGQARRFLESTGVVNPIATIPGAISAADITSEKDAARVNRSYDLLFVGRLTEVKQPDHFLRIVAAARRDVPTLTAALVGDGPLEGELRRLATELGVADRTAFLGSRPDVACILTESRIFVLTSRTEGLSIAMLEAMAAGLPVVVADVGELAEVVEQGGSGWCVRPGAIDEFAARVVSLLTDTSRYEAMSAAARRRAQSLASMESVCRGWRRAVHLMFDLPAMNACAASGARQGATLK